MKHGEVVQPQQHVGMLCEGLACSLVVVFGAYAQRNAPILEGERELVEQRLPRGGVHATRRSIGTCALDAACTSRCMRMHTTVL